MKAPDPMQVPDFTPNEKTAIRAVLGGLSSAKAAEESGLSVTDAALAFGRFHDSLFSVLRQGAAQFVENSLSSPPVDRLMEIKLSLGWQTDEDFDDTAPDYYEKQEAKRNGWEGLLKDMADQVMKELGWQSDEDFNDLAPDYLGKQKAKQSRTNQKAACHYQQNMIPEISDELAKTRATVGQALREAFASNPQIKKNDDLRIELDDAATGLEEIMSGMPEDQQRPFVDAAIADWLETNAEAIRPAAKEV